MLILQREDLARHLAAYGEHELSERCRRMPDEQFGQVCEIGFRHALTGMNLFKCGCLAAVEVLEGKPRELKRKRRQWANQPKSACTPPPILESITRRIQKYSGGQPLRKAELLEQLSGILSQSIPSFRYFKSFAQFRRSFAGGRSFIGLSYGHGSLALDFGVQHCGIDEVVGCMFPTEHDARGRGPATISVLSVNMGPQSPHWAYPTETTWPISGTRGLRLASPEIVAFVEDVAEPYVIRHRDPAAIRDTLLKDPGHATFPVDRAKTIFAVDCFLNRRDWLDEDYEHLRVRYEAFDLTREQRRTASPLEPHTPGVQIIMMMPKLSATHMVDGLKRTYQLATANWNAPQQS